MEKATGKVEEIFYIFAYRLSDSKLKGNWSQLWQNNAGHGKPLTLSLSHSFSLFSRVWLL